MEATSQPHGKPMRLCAVPKPRSPAGSTLAAHPDPSPHQGRPQTPPDPRDLPEITPKTARRLTPDRQTLLDGAARGVACARVCVCAKRGVRGSPATRNRARDHLIAACVYSQMLCQLSYGRSAGARVYACWRVHGRADWRLFRTHTGVDFCFFESSAASRVGTWPRGGTWRAAQCPLTHAERGSLARAARGHALGARRA